MAVKVRHALTKGDSVDLPDVLTFPQTTKF